VGIGDGFQVQGFFIQKKSDSPNPKEKTPHILKVTQHQKNYPRWVVHFFSKSCLGLIAFMIVISEHGKFSQFPLEIWQNLPKKSLKNHTMRQGISFSFHNF
jgi:hypothetical protein